MKILPINITLKKSYAKQNLSFGSLRGDMNELREAVGEKPFSNSKRLSGCCFQTQEEYEKLLQKNFYRFPECIEFSEKVNKYMSDLDINAVLNMLETAPKEDCDIVVKNPGFILNLADLPLSDNNRGKYKKLLEMIENTQNVNFNVYDKSGITLLEKVMNSENEIYLQTIKNVLSKKNGDNLLVYDKMQKLAFENIQNPKFKEQCKNLPIRFPDVESAIRNRNMEDLAESLIDIKCGFCDIDIALKQTLDNPSISSDRDYKAIVRSVFDKILPKEVKIYDYKKTRAFKQAIHKWKI